MGIRYEPESDRFEVKLLMMDASWEEQDVSAFSIGPVS
jgi:hypothetical protein